MTRLRYGIIGCGMMGQEHLRNIALLEDVEVVAFVEPDDAQAALAAGLVPQALRCPDLAAMLRRGELDALVIASPNHLHVSQLFQVMAQSPLPVLLEKPAFTDPSDLSRLEALARSCPAPVWVAMEYRYMPPLAAFLEQAEAATGGIRLLSIREHRFPFLDKVGHWNRFSQATGGTLVEKCCHFFDLMRLALGAEPVRIMASGGQAVNHLDEMYPEGVPDIWDNAHVILEFPGGVRAMLELCMFAEGARFQEVVTGIGPAGKIEARVPGPTRFWPSEAGPSPVAELEVSPRDPVGPSLREIPVDPTLLAAGDHNGATFYQHQRFAAMLRGQGAVEVGLADGLRAVQIGQAAQVSAVRGRTIDMPSVLSSA